MSGSLSSIARIVLIVAGNYIAPGYGGVIGGIAGSLLFPGKIPGVSGPRLGEQDFTTSTEGSPIVRVYGSHVVSGNIVWAAPLEEKKKKAKTGGKGTPSQKVTTYTYFLSFALALAEGQITGVRRIWENGKLIYDRRPQQDDETDTAYTERLTASDELDEQMTVYTGSEEQLPDPIIESFEGVGEVPGYRGLSYMVFDRREVTAFGGRPAQYKVEITRAEIVYTPTFERTTDYLPDWLSGTNDPRIASGLYEYTFDPPGVGSPAAYNTFATALAAAETFRGYSLSSTLIGWDGGMTIGLSPLDAIDPAQKQVLLLHYSHASYIDLVDPSLFYGKTEYAAAGGSYNFNPTFNALFALGLPQLTYGWAYTATGLEGFGGLVYITDSAVDIADAPFGSISLGYNNCITEFGCPYTNGGQLWGLADTQLMVRRVVVEPPLNPLDLPDWPIDPTNYWWDPETLETFSKQPWVKTFGSYRWLSLYSVVAGSVVRKPLGPAVLVGSAEDTEAAWTAAKDAAIEAGQLNADLLVTYNAAGTGDITTFPRNAAYAYERTYSAATYSDSTGVSLGYIVRSECEKSGLVSEIDFDVSELTEILTGYLIARVMPAREIIEPLRSFGRFDGVETDKLRFPLRGKAVVATLNEDDLGAYQVGESPPPIVTVDRIEDVELPYVVRVSYADTGSEYQPGTQKQSRKVGGAKDAIDVETTIAMDSDRAAKMADVMLQESWIRREHYTLKIGPQWLALEPADAILIPLRGELQRCIITADTRALPGILEVEAARDDESIYASTVSGAGTGAGEQTLTPIGDTTLLLIDSAALSSESDDAGVFIAARGESDNWHGFGLFESTDGGANFDRIEDYVTEATMGEVLDALPTGPYEIWDYANTIRVAMFTGTLESRTQDSVLGGANGAFVGGDGRWEILQFADAALEGTDSEGRSIYALTTLLRGRQGTEWAIGSSQVGDNFVLTDSVERLPMESARIGIPRLFKAVSFGRTTESGPEQTFTPNAVALECYAPTLVHGDRDGSGNLDIYATRRARIAGEWNDNDYVPLNEESEAYEIDILDGSSGVVRTLTGSTFPITYSAADQTADFGSPQTSIAIVVYQISATVGRGYPTEATL